MVVALSSEDDGGLARVAAMLAADLPRHGVATAVALQRAGPVSESLRARGVPVHIVPELIETLDRDPAGRPSLPSVVPNLFGLGPGVQALRRIARDHGASLVYSHGSWPNHLAAEATRARRGHALGAVWHLHVAPSASNLIAARVMARRGRVRAIIGVSRAVLEPYARLGPPAEVIPNGVDLEACGRAAAAPLLRARLGLPAQAFVFGYAGRLVAAKGIDAMVEAAISVLRRREAAHFVLLGGNSAASRRNRLGEVRHAFEAAGVAGRAHLPGYVPDALGWIAGFDVALTPSVYPDPCPLAVLEALALGVPVIASAVGGIPDLVEDGRTGLLLPPGDAGALAEAIIALADQPARRAAMAANARRVAHGRFGEQMMAARAAAVLCAAARMGVAA